MSILRTLFPTILLLYFFWKARKKRIYLLGIPFLFLMGNSVLFSYHLSGLFNIPRRIDSDFRLFLLLAVIWLLIGKKKRIYNPLRINSFCVFGEFIMLIILLFATLHALIALLSTGNMLIIYYDYSKIFFMFAGYWLLKQIFLSQTSKDTRHFVIDVVFIALISTIMFIIHQGIGVSIFPYAEYSEFNYLGYSLTRSFSIINPFLVLLLAFSLATIDTYKYSAVYLFVGSIAVLLSYTRSFMLALISMMALSLLQSRHIAKRILFITLSVILLNFLLANLLPVQFSFAKYRVNEVTEAFSGYTNTGFQSLSNVGNVEEREDQFSDILNSASDSQKLYGYGFALGNTKLMDGIYDSAWQAVFKYFGLFGIILFAILILSFFIASIVIMFSSCSETSIIGKMVLLMTMAMIVQSFAGLTFIPIHGAPLAFWIFALLSAEMQKNRQ